MELLLHAAQPAPPGQASPLVVVLSVSLRLG
jgi:hypothetical protein